MPQTPKSVQAPTVVVGGHEHKPASAETAAAALVRRQVERQAIYDRSDNRGSFPKPQHPGATQAEIALHDAAEGLQRHITSLKRENETGDPPFKLWRTEWTDYCRAVGKLIRETGCTDHPLMDALTVTLRLFGDAEERGRWKNVAGRLPSIGKHFSEPDFWIVYHATPMCEDGRSIEEIRGRLLRQLARLRADEGCDPDLAKTMADIGWRCEADIRQSLGTRSNLQRKLNELGIIQRRK
jgi:hypothetical protein